MSGLQFNPYIARFVREEADTALDDGRGPSPDMPVHRLQNNENPLGPSPLVIEAINATAPALSYYPSFTDIELRRAIVEALGRGLTPQHIFTGCSGFEALELVMRATLTPGDELILSSPTFAGAYKKVSLPLGAKVIDVPLEPETFRYRPEAVLDAVTERSKLIMLCNPNNPTGTLITASAMERLMLGLPDHVLVVADQVYYHFVDADDFPDSLQYVADERNIVIIHSFSKAYGLAGMRLGYGIAKPQIANSIAGLQRGFHQNKLALAAGIAACRDQNHVRRVVDYLREEARWICSQFDRLDIRYWKPAANFILFETRRPADQLEEELRLRGFLLRGQTQNGLPYCMRLSVGKREANDAFISALEDILNNGPA
ncbi:MAG: histidinol-phosphate transaminase [Chloroflexi bacterium]|nr:histidinol-phosphate transaminase [Chloroflexota bacterium]